jgi:hypothetical protein
MLFHKNFFVNKKESSTSDCLIQNIILLVSVEWCGLYKIALHVGYETIQDDLI